MCHHEAFERSVWAQTWTGLVGTAVSSDSLSRLWEDPPPHQLFLVPARDPAQNCRLAPHPVASPASFLCLFPQNCGYMGDSGP